MDIINLHQKIVRIIITLIVCGCVVGCEKSEEPIMLNLYISNDYVTNYKETIDFYKIGINNPEESLNFDNDFAISYEDFLENEVIFNTCQDINYKNNIYVFGFESINKLEQLLSKLGNNNYCFSNDKYEKVGFIINFINGTVLNVCIIPESQAKYLIYAVIHEMNSNYDYLYEEYDRFFPKQYINVKENSYFHIMNKVKNVQQDDNKDIIDITTNVIVSNSIESFVLTHSAIFPNYQVHFSPIQQENVREYTIASNGDAILVKIPQSNIFVTTTSNEVSWSCNVIRRNNSYHNSYLLNSRYILHDNEKIDIRFSSKDSYENVYSYRMNMEEIK